MNSKPLEGLHRKERRFELRETESRNVLVVGRSGTGKSTVVGVMKDPTSSISKIKGTLEPQFSSFSIDSEELDKNFTFNILDTPGLKNMNGEVRQSDAEILDMINLHLQNEIYSIHVLVISISFELGVTEDDVDAFQKYLTAFGHDDITICMCITHAEDKTDYWKEDKIKQLKEHKYFSEVLNRENVFVNFIGCVEKSRFSSVDLDSFHTNVFQMREALFRVIFNAQKRVKFADLPFFTNIKNQLEAMFVKQEQILTHLMNVSDYSTQEVKLLIDQFAENTEAMVRHGGLLGDKQFYNRFQTLKDNIFTILPRFEDEDTKKRFQGKLSLKPCK